jgi:DNA-binding MarR family transcriptional regulator
MSAGLTVTSFDSVVASPTIVEALNRAAAAVRHHVEAAVLRRADLSWTGYSLLSVVCDHHPLETRTAASLVGVSRGTLTGVVRTLEGKDLLRRVPHSSDGRLVLLEPTMTGRRLYGRLRPGVRAAEDYAVSCLGSAERNALTGLLNRVAVDLGADTPA